MQPISAKQFRKMDRSLGMIYSPKGIVPYVFRPGTTAPRDALVRELHLNNNKWLEFTEDGYAEFRFIVETIDKADILSGA